MEIILTNIMDQNLMYSLNSNQEKFDRKSSKVIYFELSKCYLPSVPKIRMVIYWKNTNGVKNRLFSFS